LLIKTNLYEKILPNQTKPNQTKPIKCFTNFCKTVSVLLVTIILFTNITYSQSGQEWATGGNSIGIGDFLGTTNNRPLLFKVNNALALKINVGGSVLLKSLANNGNGIVSFDNTGKLIPFTYPNDATKVFLGNGTFGNIPIPQNYWQLNGTNLYTTTPGYVGIGTNNPQFTLDVDGEVRITQNLYVGGGIIITDKVNAATQIATNKMQAVSIRADSIVMDSTKAVYGQANFAGDVKLANKLRVDGDVQVNGDFKTAGNLIFASNKIISYTPSQNGNTGSFGFGTQIPAYLIDQCPTTNAEINKNWFGGSIKCWGNASWNVNQPVNVLTVGSDGVHGIIDVAGSSTLLINYFCGKDVVVGGGGAFDPLLPNSGKFTTLYDTYLASNSGKVGIGTSNANATLDVQGDVRISSLEANQGTTNLIQVDQNGLLSPISSASAGIGLWLQNGNYIYNANIGNIQINQHPLAKVKIYGDGSATENMNWVTEHSLVLQGSTTNMILGVDPLLNKAYIGATVFNPPNLDAATDLILNPKGGNVGIGTNNIDEKLTVFGNIHSTGNIINGGSDFILGLNDNRANSSSGHRALVHDGWNFQLDELTINYDGDFLDGVHVMGNKTYFDGNVGIGTNNPNSKLQVKVDNNANAISILNGSTENFLVKGDGKVWAREINVKLGNLGDFVFENNYKLLSINDLENYVDKNHHLPGIPSANEVNENGLNVGEFQNLLLQKIEELTLYIIDLKNENNVLKEEIKKLKSLNNN